LKPFESAFYPRFCWRHYAAHPRLLYAAPRHSVRISMAPSPILVGRRFRPRFSEARAIFLVPSPCRIGMADAWCGIRVFSDFFG
ncbi:hypothetical protein, partial [Burkholderia sp. BCC0097]|uniref:hypothetical protein n=1 Tax=Burkholderia sp. BCC0097 TaxID=2676289 RepID=UPI001ABA0D55